MPDISACYCAKCEAPLSVSTSGCATCSEARKHFVIPETQPEDFEDTTLGAALQQQMRILKLASDRLEHDMHNMHWKDRQSRSRAKWRYDKDHGKEAMSLARASATLLGEVRKFEAQQADDVSKMSYREKLELIVAMVENFPKDLQQSLLNRVDRLLAPPQNAETVE